jgi:hypothetical protein
MLQSPGIAMFVACMCVPAMQATAQRSTLIVDLPATPSESSTVVVAGKSYAKGSIYRWFFGDTYRDLWTTPIRIPLFDWHTFAGGLRPTKEGGGNQTRNLRFETADGAEWVFRRSDKAVNTAPPILDGTVVFPFIEDEISAQHPAGSIMAAPIVAAAGVLHPTPVLMVMPDDSALGKFRGDFAGKLGMVEEYPNVPKGANTGFGGATKIVDSEELLKLLNADPNEQVDERVFLAARLTDFLINDNDRHEGNWKWAQLPSEPKGEWEPIARDRDHAFMSLDGAVMKVLRLAKPSLVELSAKPDVRGLIDVPPDVDSRLLAGLEKPVWDSVAKAVQARITDAVINDATHAMPIEYQASAPRLTAVIEQRRAKLLRSADDFYRRLAERVAIHGTDQPDRAAIVRLDDGIVELRLASHGTRYFSRRFDARETKELLVYLHGGDDTAVVSGIVDHSILIRVIGGNGINTFIDSSIVGGHRRPTRFYDRGTVEGISYGPDTTFDRRPWESLDDSLGPHQLDAGNSLAPSIGLNSYAGAGLTPVVGITKYSYGFSRRPYATMINLQAEYATQSPAGRLALTVDRRLESSSVHFTVFAHISDFQLLAFHGFGNATSDDGPNDRFFAVAQRQWLFRPAIALAIGQHADISFGPELQHSSTDSVQNRYLSTARPYGFGTFNQAGLRFGIQYVLPFAGPHSARRTKRIEHTTHRVAVDAHARYVPAMMDLRSAFEEVGATAGVSTTIPLPTNPLLAVQSGANKVFGNFPFYEAATLGGENSLRYMDAQRYGGDASMWTTSDLRVPLVRFTLLAPLRAGVVGVVETGRVYDRGTSPGGWHSVAGGGVWLGLESFPSILTVTRTDELGQTVPATFQVRFGLNF